MNAAQLGELLPNMDKDCVLAPEPNKLGMMSYASIQEVDMGGPEVQDHLRVLTTMSRSA